MASSRRGYRSRWCAWWRGPLVAGAARGPVPAAGGGGAALGCGGGAAAGGSFAGARAAGGRRGRRRRRRARLLLQGEAHHDRAGQRHGLFPGREVRRLRAQLSRPVAPHHLALERADREQRAVQVDLGVARRDAHREVDRILPGRIAAAAAAARGAGSAVVGGRRRRRRWRRRPGARKRTPSTMTPIAAIPPTATSTKGLLPFGGGAGSSSVVSALVTARSRERARRARGVSSA